MVKRHRKRGRDRDPGQVISFRADSRLLAFLERRRARRGVEESLGLTAKRLLSWMAVLLEAGHEELQSRLTEDEIMAALQSMRDATMAAEVPPHLLLHARPGEEISRPLLEKIRSLSPAGQMALSDLAWRAWLAGDRKALKSVAGQR